MWHRGTPSGPSGPVLVIGEPVRAAGIRACLQQDLGIEEVRVALSIELDDEDRATLREEGVLESGDLLARDERSLLDFAQGAQPSLVVADPYYAELFGASGARFLALPHEAQSSRSYRHLEVALAGAKGLELLQ